MSLAVVDRYPGTGLGNNSPTTRLTTARLQAQPVNEFVIPLVIIVGAVVVLAAFATGKIRFPPDYPDYPWD